MPRPSRLCFTTWTPVFFFCLGKPFGGRGKIQVTVGNKIMVWIRVLSFEGGIWVEFWLNFD